MAQQEFTQHFPQPGWVEHNPEEIWASQQAVMHEVLQTSGIRPQQVAGIGITNQRETAVLWNAETGRPIHNAIVWQDKRTAPICEQLKADGLEPHIRKATGLVADAYFSGTKVAWLLQHVEGAQNLAQQGKLRFGTVDSWLVWKLTGGKVHATDYSNASRTLLYNINTLSWDDTLLNALNIPKSLLPQVCPSSHLYGHYHYQGHDIPICGIAGDQQAALFGQACFEPGTAKNTYGTGFFMLMNTGTAPKFSDNGLLTTIAWGLDGQVEYALEGSIFIAGAAVQWLRDALKIIDTAADSEYFALKAGDSDGVYVVPAFAGLGAPYWDMYARGAIFGLTRDTGKSHIIKATLESMAYQTKDVLMAMQQDAGLELSTLKVDGGAVANNMLMQFQADMLGVPVERPAVTETTAMGAAYLAGIHAGVWQKQHISSSRVINSTFTPELPASKRNELYSGWQKAVKRTLGWLDDDA